MDNLITLILKISDADNVGQISIILKVFELDENVMHRCAYDKKIGTLRHFLGLVSCRRAAKKNARVRAAPVQTHSSVIHKQPQKIDLLMVHA